MNDFSTTKFINLLKNISESELKQYAVWLKSPWCNSNKNLIALLDAVKKDYPSFDNPKLTKEKLFRKILPKGKFSARRMNNLLSEAAQSVEKFLTFQHLQNDPQQQKDFLNQELQQRHLDDYFFKSIESDITVLEAKEVKDWEDHLQLLQWYRRIYHHPTQQPRMKPGGQTIVRMGEELDILYALERAAIINEKITRKRILKNEEHDIEQELARWQFLTKDLQHPALELYRMRFAYTEEEQLEQYNKLHDTFFNTIEFLNYKEQKVHLVSLLNDCFRLIRLKILSVKQTLNLYKFGLSRQLLITKGKISLSHFITIVMVSNFNQDFSFSKKFVRDYISKLDNSFSDDGIIWSMSHIMYWEKKLIESLELLNSHHFQTQHFQILSRILTTQIYFDLFLNNDSYEFYLFSYLNTFEKWIAREKLRSKLLKKSYLRFIQITRSLAKYNSDPNNPTEKIKNILKNENNIQAVEWLNARQKIILQNKNNRNTL